MYLQQVQGRLRDCIGPTQSRCHVEETVMSQIITFLEASSAHLRMLRLEGGLDGLLAGLRRRRRAGPRSAGSGCRRRQHGEQGGDGRQGCVAGGRRRSCCGACCWGTVITRRLLSVQRSACLHARMSHTLHAGIYIEPPGLWAQQECTCCRGCGQGRSRGDGRVGIKGGLRAGGRPSKLRCKRPCAGPGDEHAAWKICAHKDAQVAVRTKPRRLHACLSHALHAHSIGSLASESSRNAPAGEAGRGAAAGMAG